MKKNLSSLVLITSMMGLATGQQSAEREAYEKIDKRVLFRGEKKLTPDFVFPSVEERSAARKELRDIVTRVIQGTVSAKGATEESIVEAIVELQNYDFWERSPGEHGVPFTHFVTLRGIPIMTAAFPVLSGGTGIGDVSAHIQFYSKLGGSWNLIAETGKDFEDCVFYVAPLRSPVEGQAWYLAWGSVVGATHQRLKMRLYAFDGFSLRTVWSRDGLSGGQVKIENDGSVTLHYFLLPPKDQLIPPTEIIQRLRPTVRGLEP
jgi:hypothetical protein